MKYTHNYHCSYYIFKLFMLFAFSINMGCKKLVEVEPPITSITGDNVYNNDRTATAVLTGLYAQISENAFTNIEGLNSLGRITGASADELNVWNGTNNSRLFAYYTNSLEASESFSAGGEMWNVCYSNLYVCNSALEGLTKSTTLSTAVKQQLLGEVHFMRALYYFFLTNLYGDVPLVLSTDYAASRKLPRSPKDDVYVQIISDLQEARLLLSELYLDATLLKVTQDRVRPTKSACDALLARILLFTGNWVSAEALATNVIEAKNIYDTVPLNEVFVKNSKEAIWQLQPVNGDWNTEEAKAYLFQSSAFSNDNPFSLTSWLLNSFEPGDLRGVDGNWIKSINIGGFKYYQPNKYKQANLGAPVTEYLMMLRLAEQYLIRAEARTRQGNLSGAKSDIDILRRRAGLSGTTASNESELLTDIIHERQVELFTEWGHRWIDLKRYNTINSIMSQRTPVKGGTWEDTDEYFPLPLSDLKKNNNLSQNSGY